MSKDFEQRTALVTGAGSGIGLLTAQTMAERGAAVVLVDNRLDAAQAGVESIVAAGGKAIAVEADIRDFKQVVAAVEQANAQFGGVDILVNCAGGNAGRIWNCTGPWHEMPYEAIEWGIDVNLKGQVFFARAVLPGMVERKRGVIVNISSIDAFTGATFGIEYSACKNGLITLTKSLALCGAPHGVRSVCVAPGPVLTRPGMAKMKTPLGRAAEPIEVVNLICYLASDQAAYITGSCHLIDGGRACGGMV